MRLEWAFLGRVPYARALRAQRVCEEQVRGGAPARLMLLEHPPIFTLGRQADPRNLLWSDEELQRRGIEVCRVARGGDVTYHGPGQLVGYPIASLAKLRCRVPDWVRGCAEVLVDFLAARGLSARWSETHPGVWVGGEKIAALGFAIRRRISTHGFALNLAPDLSHYEGIVACGLRNRRVTSMAQLGLTSPRMEQAAAEIAGRFAARFGFAAVEPVCAENGLHEERCDARLACNR